ncbi:MAG: bifunctional glutamate N-acetyltransferase/amino-acid acetyltransferase ArgJ [Candidatus Omnitrophica bacterium]|nr:bifunctional glutamate N-acetyltransferase/amino-acid acetyltransferase ArgJ [Candidatus Omnitrophota bacterium]
MSVLRGGITAPLGFRAAGIWSGIKRNRKPDLALIVSMVPASAAGVYTTNRIQAAPIVLTKRRFHAGRGQAILANSGCANCATGRQGLRDASVLTAAVADTLGIDERLVVMASTGVIGRRLPTPRLLRRLPELVRRVSRRRGHDAATAILTTDTEAKECAVSGRIGSTTIRIGGMAKGAGMIAPHMATMLCFLTTDAGLTPRLLRAALRRASAPFNQITVDGDMSTNDAALLLANGLAGNRTLRVAGPAFEQFCALLTRVTEALACAIVRDGEGATKVAGITVRHARTLREADRCARQVANSPLVKTMLAGGDVNVGRVIAAVGASPARFRPERLEVRLDGLPVFRQGTMIGAARRHVRSALQRAEVQFIIDLHAGGATSTVHTCDLTEHYVRINARYTT